MTTAASTRDEMEQSRHCLERSSVETPQHLTPDNWEFRALGYRIRSTLESALCASALLVADASLLLVRDETPLRGLHRSRDQPRRLLTVYSVVWKELGDCKYLLLERTISSVRIRT